MSISHDDPRLTAHALGELSSEELAQLEVLLQRDVRARAELTELGELALRLQRELGGTDAPALSAQRRAALLSAAAAAANAVKPRVASSASPSRTGTLARGRRLGLLLVALVPSAIACWLLLKEESLVPEPAAGSSAARATEVEATPSPAISTPAASTPAASTPTASTPTASAPASSAPGASAPPSWTAAGATLPSVVPYAKTLRKDAQRSRVQVPDSRVAGGRNAEDGASADDESDDEDSFGAEGGVVAGVVGGAVGGVLGGGVPAGGAARTPSKSTPTLLSAKAGHRLLAINPQVRPYKLNLPEEDLRIGNVYVATLRICVGPEGSVSSVRILEPSLPAIDAQIPKVIPRWKYRPYLVDGQPTGFCYNINYSVSS